MPWKTSEVQKIYMRRKTRELHALNLNELLFDRPYLSFEQNISIIGAVYKIIRYKKRYNQ